MQHVKDFVLSKIPGEEKDYFSCDSKCRLDKNKGVQGEWFTTEFLNDIKCFRLPNHKLTLKLRVPIMLMRNIDQAADLTRLRVDILEKSINGATMLTENNVGDKVLISRINLVPSDPGLPFKFERRQFPLYVLQ